MRGGGGRGREQELRTAEKSSSKDFNKKCTGVRRILVYLDLVFEDPADEKAFFKGFYAPAIRRGSRYVLLITLFRLFGLYIGNVDKHERIPTGSPSPWWDVQAIYEVTAHGIAVLLTLPCFRVGSHVPGWASTAAFYSSSLVWLIGLLFGQWNIWRDTVSPFVIIFAACLASRLPARRTLALVLLVMPVILMLAPSDLPAEYRQKSAIDGLDDGPSGGKGSGRALDDGSGGKGNGDRAGAGMIGYSGTCRRAPIFQPLYRSSVRCRPSHLTAASHGPWAVAPLPLLALLCVQFALDHLSPCAIGRFISRQYLTSCCRRPILPRPKPHPGPPWVNYWSNLTTVIVLMLMWHIQYTVDRAHRIAFKQTREVVAANGRTKRVEADLLSMFAHELRNPLNGTVASLQFAQITVTQLQTDGASSPTTRDLRGISTDLESAHTSTAACLQLLDLVGAQGLTHAQCMS